MIVRGYGSLDDTKIADETIPEETFTLCDYYQIQGNEHQFTITTLVKKKGKATGEIGNIEYKFDKEQTPIVFSSNADKNAALLNCDSKLIFTRREDAANLYDFNSRFNDHVKTL